MQTESVFASPAASAFGLAFPGLDNQATAISPVALMLAILLMLTAGLAFVLAWQLQAKARKTKRLQDQLLAQGLLCQEALDALPFPIALHGMDGQAAMLNEVAHRNPGALEAVMAVMCGDDFAVDKTALLQGDGSPHALDYMTSDGTAHPAHV